MTFFQGLKARLDVADGEKKNQGVQKKKRKQRSESAEESSEKAKHFGEKKPIFNHIRAAHSVG